MIIIDKIQTIVVAPPKCGTVSTHYRWTKDDIGGFWVMGPQPNGTYGKHTTVDLSSEYNYRRVCLIREPYARALSIRKHWYDYSGIKCSLDTFIEKLIQSDYWFDQPITSYIDGCDELWPIEYIDKIAEQNSLPSLPHLNIGTVDGEWSVRQKDNLFPYVKNDLAIYKESIKQWQN